MFYLFSSTSSKAHEEQSLIPDTQRRTGYDTIQSQGKNNDHNQNEPDALKKLTVNDALLKTIATRFIQAPLSPDLEDDPMIKPGHGYKCVICLDEIDPETMDADIESQVNSTGELGSSNEIKNETNSANEQIQRGVQTQDKEQLLFNIQNCSCHFHRVCKEQAMALSGDQQSCPGCMRTTAQTPLDLLSQINRHFEPRQFQQWKEQLNKAVNTAYQNLSVKLQECFSATLEKLKTSSALRYVGLGVGIFSFNLAASFIGAASLKHRFEAWQVDNNHQALLVSDLLGSAIMTGLNLLFIAPTEVCLFQEGTRDRDDRRMQADGFSLLLYRPILHAFGTPLGNAMLSKKLSPEVAWAAPATGEAIVVAGVIGVSILACIFEQHREIERINNRGR